MSSSLRGGQKRSWVMSSFQVENENVSNLERKIINAASNRKTKPNFIIQNLKKKENLWIDRHIPIDKETLAVNKKKVGEVEDWIVKYFAVEPKNGDRKNPILLLTGPSGVGKTTTIKTLAKCLNLEIKEWINPISDFRRDFDEISGSYNYRDSIQYESQKNLFWEFFLRANKYRSLSFENEDEGLKRIILIEDFPNIFTKNPSDFHSILRKFSKMHCSPAVFIVSDNIKYLNTRTIFPHELQEELGIITINFNPITTQNILKVLTKIASIELQTSPSKQMLENIVQMSCGDIRLAINTLQFSHCNKHRSSQSQSKNDSQSDSTKDTTLFLFHAIGKILHCKRHSDQPTDKCDLPQHLSTMARLPMLPNPEEIVNNISISSDCLQLYIHQNYLKFNDDINEIVRASRYLSDADIVTSEWTGRSVLEECASLIAVRGIMHSKVSPNALGWNPLHKPYWYTANKLLSDRKYSIKCLNNKLSSVTAATVMFPYVKLISCSSYLKGSSGLIKDLTTFSRNIKNEELLEPSEIEIECKNKEKEKDLSEKSSQIIIDEDDFTIEDYSD